MESGPAQHVVYRAQGVCARDRLHLCEQDDLHYTKADPDITERNVPLSEPRHGTTGH